jgi:hypothetical protein
MKLEQLVEIVCKQAAARKDGTGTVIPVEADVTVFVGMPGETLTVQRVARIEVLDPLLLLETAKAERFIVRGEDVRALKIERAESRAGSAGFGKV